MARGDDDLVSIEELARRFASESLAPSAEADDHYPFRPWNRAAWSKAAELGLPGLALPESLGGSGLGLLALARTLERVAAAEAGHATLLLVQSLARATLHALGPEPLAARVCSLRGSADEALLAYPLYADPDLLDEVPEVRTEGNGYVLDGELPHLACAPIASTLVVPARERGSGEVRILVVPADTQGVHVSAPVVTLGVRPCPVADVVFAGARVASSARAGSTDACHVYAREAERYRPVLVALQLGVLRGSFDLALGYARERRQAKRQIIEHHMVQELLSGMLATLELGRLALPEACALAERADGSTTELLALQSMLCAATAQATTDGVQVLGGNGYMHEYGQEKRMRDAKQLQAALGSAETRRLRIVERLLARA